MAQPTKPGNHERGWNDPPMFIHTGATGPGMAQPRVVLKRTPLNKRVAYPVPSPSVSHPDGAPPADPLVGTPAPSTSPGGGVIILPPTFTTELPKFPAPIIIPGMIPPDGSPGEITMATNPVTHTQINLQVSQSDDLHIPDFDNDEQLYHFVTSRLQRVCKDCRHRLQQRVSEDILRKLDIFSDMWRGGNISYPVKSNMARLATALHRRQCDVAHQIHLSLMMDYVSEVGQWMVGVKRLIQEARSTEAPLSPTDSTAPLIPNLIPTNSAVICSDEDKPNMGSHPEDKPSEKMDSENVSSEIVKSQDDDSNIGASSSVNQSAEMPVGQLSHNARSDSTPAIIDTTPIG